MDRSPKLPKFFWIDVRSPETGRPDGICEAFGCDQGFEERYGGTLSYLRKHLDRLWAEGSHQAPKPHFVVVKNPPGSAPVSLAAGSMWLKIRIQNKDNHRRYLMPRPPGYSSGSRGSSPQSARYLSLTPDKISIETFDHANIAELPKSVIPSPQTFDEHYRWIANSVHNCTFEPSGSESVLESYCHGAPIESLASEVRGVYNYLIIHQAVMEEMSKEDLLVETMKTVADYNIAFPALRSAEDLYEAYYFITSDAHDSRWRGKAPVLKDRMLMSYALNRVDRHVLLSEEIMQMMDYLDGYVLNRVVEHSKAMSGSEMEIEDARSKLERLFSKDALVYAEQAEQVDARDSGDLSGFSDVVAFSSTRAARDLVDDLTRESGYRMHRNMVTRALEERFLQYEPTGHTLMYTAILLYEHLSFEFLLKLQIAWLEHYHAMNLVDIIEDFDFSLMEKAAYGIAKLAGEHEIEDMEEAIVEISKFLRLMPLIASSNNHEYIREILGAIQLHLSNVMELSHQGPTPVTFTGPEVSQIFRHQRYRNPALVIDPDVYLMLALIEIKLAKNFLFSNKLVPHSELKNFLFSHSSVARSFVDDVYQNLEARGSPSFHEQMRMVFPYEPDGSDLWISKHNLFLLMGLYYEHLPFPLLKALESEIMNFYRKHPIDLLADELDVRHVVEDALKGRYMLPKPLVSRIQTAIDLLITPKQGHMIADDFYQNVKYISSLMDMHKSLLFDKQKTLAEQSFYLYTFETRQDEVALYYLRLSGADPMMMVDYFINKIEDIEKRNQCEEMMDSGTIPPSKLTVLTYGQYPPCWRAWNVARELKRHGE